MERLRGKAASLHGELQGIAIKGPGIHPERHVIHQLDGQRSEQKSASKEMGQKIGQLEPAERQLYLEAQKALKTELQAMEERERELKSAMDVQLLLIPNVPDDDVPEGKDDQAK